MPSIGSDRGHFFEGPPPSLPKKGRGLDGCWKTSTEPYRGEKFSVVGIVSNL